MSRAFAHFLSLANAAETHNRVRQLREELIHSDGVLATPNREDSLNGTINELLGQGKSPSDIYHAITSQKIELVLTAHPTEVSYTSSNMMMTGSSKGKGIIWLAR